MLPSVENETIAHRGSHPNNSFTVSQEEIAIDARSAGDGSTHTALSPISRYSPSDPSNPGMIARPVDDGVSMPSFRPMIVVAARITSPVVCVSPANVTSARPMHSITIAVYIGSLLFRVSALTESMSEYSAM